MLIDTQYLYDWSNFDCGYGILYLMLAEKKKVQRTESNASLEYKNEDLALE